MKSSLTSRLVALHARLQHSSGPNAFTLRIPAPSKLNILEWRSRLTNYPDTQLCDFLEFGWPVGYSNATPLSSFKNHGSALSRPDIIDRYLATKCALGATCGPFSSNPLSTDLPVITSPLQVAYSKIGKPCVVVDLSFPHDHSVNTGIPASTYLGDSFKLHLPGIDALLEIVRLKGHHCHLFIMDLSRCSALLSVDQVSRHDLQSLLGVMSFVTACVCPACIFMSTLLNTLHEHRSARVCPLSADNKADLHWWCHFLPFYNGVSLIKTSPLINNLLYLSTNACSTSAGGFFNSQYFHTPFPRSILQCFKHDINILEFLSIMVALKL